MDYKITPEDKFQPGGPDGKGWNRLVMGCGNMSSPMARCLLKPLSWQAAWELHNRGQNAAPHQFGLCSNVEGTCVTCPIATRERTSYKGGASLAVVREYDDGSVWILNRRDKGWGEFGYRYVSWADFVQSENVFLGNRRQDEHGMYFEIIAG